MKKLLALACLASAGWTWENPQPLGSKLAAAVEHGGVVHAVGERGAIVRSRDDGRTWQVLASPVTADLFGVAAADKLIVAVGDKGTILRSRDGIAFAARPSPVTDGFVGVAIAGAAIYAVTTEGALVRSSDAGDTFASLPCVGKGVRPTGILAC